MKLSMIYNQNIFKIGNVVLILLWSYTGLSKILGHSEFERQIALLFPAALVMRLAITIPALEIVAAITLAFQRTYNFGLNLSLLLITAFTIYVLMVINGYFGATPCSCGGIISSLSWKQHLALNTMFLCLVIYLLFAKRIRKEVAVTHMT